MAQGWKVGLNQEGNDLFILQFNTLGTLFLKFLYSFQKKKKKKRKKKQDK